MALYKLQLRLRFRKEVQANDMGDLDVKEVGCGLPPP